MPSEEDLETVTLHVSTLLALGASTRMGIARRRLEHPTDLLDAMKGAFCEGQLDVLERRVVDGYARWLTEGEGEGESSFVGVLKDLRDLCLARVQP